MAIIKSLALGLTLAVAPLVQASQPSARMEQTSADRLTLLNWQPALDRLVASTILVHSALTIGPTWSDAASAWNEHRRQYPEAFPSAQNVLPAISLVAGAAQKEDIAVPSNVIYVRFSKPFLESYFCKSIDERSSIRDTVLGANVVGTRYTRGSTALTLVPNPDQAEATLRLSGTNFFTSVGSQQQVRIHSRGTTRFSAETTLHFDGQRVRYTPIEASAETNTTTTGITTSLPGLRRRIALRIARREEAASHRRAEQITSERTRNRVANSFEKRIAERTAAFTETLKQQYAKLRFDGRFSLQEVRCNTTPRIIELVLIGRGDAAPNYADAPAFLDGDPDIEFHAHTSLVQKAIIDSELRETLASAVASLVDRPVLTLVAAARNAGDREPHRDLTIHWSEGAGEWLGLAWHAKENPSLAANAKSKRSKPSPMRVRR